MCSRSTRLVWDAAAPEADAKVRDAAEALPNAKVQLQARYNHCDVVASE